MDQRLRSPEEIAHQRRFEMTYRLGQASLKLDIERRVCGCDYGGTSWSTRAEVDRIGKLLGLGAGRQLLEVGAGSGWPGLYLAQTTGCDAALIDLPHEGLKIAVRRARADRPAGACLFAVADGAAIPFPEGAFDAIVHSDVLCCLVEKSEVLQNCRRVIREGGRMIFSVIMIAAGLAPDEQAQAAAAAPMFAASALDYPAMLRRTGWRIEGHEDLSEQFRQSVQLRWREEREREDALRALLGDEDVDDRFAARPRCIAALERGLIRRELFSAVPA